MPKSKPDRAKGASVTEAAEDGQATGLKREQARVVAKRKAADQVFGDLYARLLTDAEVAAFLRKSARSIRRYAKERVIPSIRMGRGRRYRLADARRRSWLCLWPTRL